MDKQDFKVLVVDDDEMVREIIGSILSQHGYSVISAKDGLEAISLLLMFDDIKLVITDLRMPGADGIEVLEHAVRNNPDIAVVMLTAYSTIETAYTAINKGAFDYLTKPFDVEQIVFVAEKAFKREVLVDENREMRKLIRDTYRDMEIIKSVKNSGSLDVVNRWIERMNRLKAMNILTESEVKILKEKLVNTDA
ncbi:MAG: response regulator [Thermoproteota archaeon]